MTASGLRSTGIMSAGPEVIDAFRRFEDIGAGVEGDQQAGDGSFGDFAQEGLQLGIGAGRVKSGPHASNGRSRRIAAVADRDH